MLAGDKQGRRENEVFNLLYLIKPTDPHDVEKPHHSAGRHPWTSGEAATTGRLVACDSLAVGGPLSGAALTNPC